MSWRVRVFRFFFVAAIFVVAKSAEAEPKKDKKAACVDAYKQGQVHRKNGELSLARDDFAVCADSVCPSVLRKDCTPWLVSVQQAIPSIIVNVASATGKPLSSTRILIDGKTPEKMGADGDIEVDPGAHVVRVEALGHQPLEKSFKVRSGEKKIAIDMKLALEVARESVSRPIPGSTIVFGVIGLAGIGAFAGFGLHGNELKKGLDACKPGCVPVRVDEVKRDYIIADAALGVGLVFLGLATWSFFTRPEVHRQTAVWTVHVAPGQAMLRLGGRF